MSIYASWDEIGENIDGYAAVDPLTLEAIPAVGSPFTREVLTYNGSHAYPNPATDRPAMVGVSHIPGFIAPPPAERPQTDDQPVAPYLRLDISAWHPDWDRPMTSDTATCVLTRPAVEKLRDQLIEWLGMEMHDV
ncbi:MAG: hypothetical protein INR72_15540 [Williamsia herbipolensis]|nr:hypothetical protein [Williamsia herbipolensis]